MKKYEDYVRDFKEYAKTSIDIAVDKAGIWVALRRAITLDDNIDRCSCYSETRKQGDPDCLYCYGGWFENGYHPIEIIRASASDELINLIKTEPRGLLEVTVAIATFPALPIVRDDDLAAIVLFNPEKHKILKEIRRFIIEDVNYQVWGDATIGQDVSLKMIDHRAVEMRVPFET